MPPHLERDGSLSTIPPTAAAVTQLGGGNALVVGHDGSRMLDNKTHRQAQKTNKKNKRSWDYVVKSGVAGGLAGCAAKTVVGPLDRVKILFQASSPQFAKYSGSWFGLISAMRDINQHEGLRGLFRGHSATLLRIFPYAGIKFLAYEQIRSVLIPDLSKETPLRRLLSGSLAGVTSVFFTYPLEIIRVRLAFETKKDSKASLRRICRTIYHEHPPIPPDSALGAIKPSSGFINFYRGFTPTLAGMVPYAGMSFLTHDTVGDWLRHPSLVQYTTIPGSAEADRGNKSRLKDWAELTSGASAGLISQTVSYPLEVIRRRMQVGGAVGDGKMLTMRETAMKIFAERGASGFFVGLSIGYIKVVPLAAVSFWVYERCKLAFGI